MPPIFKALSRYLALLAFGQLVIALQLGVLIWVVNGK